VYNNCDCVINISKKKLIISILNKKFIYINIDKNFQ
jgi:hypothetical protein